MIEAICRTYWESDFVHYVLFGFLGPLVGTILMLILRKKIKANYWLKASAVFFIVNLSSCAASWKANTGCQIHLFGEVSDDPGDIGVVFMTFPLFVLCFFGGLAIAFWFKEMIKAPSAANSEA
ncbi:hypothetical protein [Bdellovibrio sp. HCB337]|uniref:hypothetical protein n=1 Tax=Bdellovibrio sp. HCB337 TaxID=3394358 RepID=UPI0039A4DE80